MKGVYYSPMNQPSSNNNQRRRRRNNNRNRKNNNSGGNRQNNSQSDSGPRKKNNRRSNHRRRRYGNKPNLTPEEKKERQYITLLEKHLQARAKYFSLYHRADPRQLAKVERNYYNTMHELVEMRASWDDSTREYFTNKHQNLKADRIYSENHGISPQGENVELEGNYEDPHLLQTQKESTFSEDTEESSGSLEDYNAYKSGEEV